MEYSIIIPIFNENEKVNILLKELKSLNKDYEIIIVDDGSNDGTTEKLSTADDIILVRNKINVGKSASIVKGLDIAKGRYVILFDGDLEIKVKEIKNLIIHHKTNKYQIIKGTRTMLNETLSLFSIGSKILNNIFNLIYNTSFKDIFCCLIIIERSLINTFNIKSKKFGIETEIMAKIALEKISCKEVRVNYKRRKNF